MSRSDYGWGLGSETEERLSDEAVELILYAQNDHGAYKAWILPMLKACQRHYLRGDGDFEKAVNGFTRVFLPIARQYLLEHGTMTDSVRSVFPPAVRQECGRHMAEYFVAEFRAGNRW